MIQSGKANLRSRVQGILELHTIETAFTLQMRDEDFLRAIDRLSMKQQPLDQHKAIVLAEDF